MAFAPPAVASKFAPRDNPSWYGKLLYVYPTAVEERLGTNQQTGQPEPYKVVVADIAIIDLPDPEKGTPYTVILQASVGGKAMVPQFSPLVGKGTAVLGRLSKLPAQGQKDGAYILNNYTDADAALATQFEASAGDWRGALSQPAAPVPTPAPAAAASYGSPPVGQPSAAVPVGPWFMEPQHRPLAEKLQAHGVPFATLDLATAQFTAQGLA